MKLTSRPAYSEAAFRRYEEPIIKILANFPNPTKIDPSPNSAETYTHRLRDAIKAYGHSDWVSHISKDQLRATFKLFKSGGTFLISRTHDDQILIGPFQSKDQPPSGVQKVNISLGSDMIDGSDEEVLRAILFLVNKNVISGPLKLVGVKDQLIALQFPNVEMVDAKTHVVVL